MLKVFTVGRFGSVGLVGRKMVEATSNILIPSGALKMTSVPNWNSIGLKLAKLANLNFLAGWAGLQG